MHAVRTIRLRGFWISQRSHRPKLSTCGCGGNNKGLFSTDPNGYPILTLTDGRGLGILLHIERDGSRFIRIFDRGNKERVRLQWSDILSSLVFLTPQGEPSATLGNTDGSPFLIVGEATGSNCFVKVEKGEARLTLKNPMCKGSVNLTAQTKTAQVSVGAPENKSFAALVYDDGMLPRTRIGVIQDGKGKWMFPTPPEIPEPGRK